MPARITLFLLLACVMASGCNQSRAGRVDPDRVHESQQLRFRVETVASGFSHPWGMAFLPDGTLLVTERSGRLSRLDLASGRRSAISGLPEIKVQGQGGLLDVALHPRFVDNGLVYLSYAAASEGGISTHVGRGRLDGDRLRDFQRIFRATPAGGGGQHFGGRLQFDREGLLFIGLGDRGQRERAQDLTDHNGSLIRIRDDGAIPADNPYLGRQDAEPAIYSHGHRNIQGLALHPDSGRLWLHEHGPRGGDEINIPQAGRNYGWPLITYGREYHGPSIGPAQAPGLEQPIHQWTPSIAPSGMEFYTGDAFPAWRGDLFVGALKLTHLARLSLDGERVVSEERLLEDEGMRIRAVRQGPDGLLYLLVDRGEDAPLLRLRPVE